MTDKCHPPDVTCLWRVAGVSKLSQQYRRSVGLVRAPNREIALRVAIERYSSIYSDLEIPDDENNPLANFPLESQ